MTPFVKAFRTFRTSGRSAAPPFGVLPLQDFQQAEPTLRIGSARCRVAAPRESALIPERTMVLRGWMGLAASDSVGLGREFRESLVPRWSQTSETTAA